jgi:hypothetical protein
MTAPGENSLALDTRLRRPRCAELSGLLDRPIGSVALATRVVLTTHGPRLPPGRYLRWPRGTRRRWRGAGQGLGRDRSVGIPAATRSRSARCALRRRRGTPRSALAGRNGPLRRCAGCRRGATRSTWCTGVAPRASVRCSIAARTKTPTTSSRPVRRFRRGHGRWPSSRLVSPPPVASCRTAGNTGVARSGPGIHRRSGSPPAVGRTRRSKRRSQNLRQSADRHPQVFQHREVLFRATAEGGSQPGDDRPTERNHIGAQPMSDRPHRPRRRRAIVQLACRRIRGCHPVNMPARPTTTKLQPR